MIRFTIRPATADDWPTLVDFNRRLAAETEDLQLDADVVTAGVQAALADPAKARYYVACCEGRVVGQLMHTREWSDWRNGDIWWLQSVYVHADYRGQGVFRALYEHLESLATGDPRVAGLRLYVENENTRAQEVYRRLGLAEGGYSVMQRLWRG